MSRWRDLWRWLKRAPRRDPKVDRVMSATRTTRMRREKEHDRLFKSLSIPIHRDMDRRDNGHAD